MSCARRLCRASRSCRASLPVTGLDPATEATVDPCSCSSLRTPLGQRRNESAQTFPRGLRLRAPRYARSSQAHRPDQSRAQLEPPEGRSGVGPCSRGSAASALATDWSIDSQPPRWPGVMFRGVARRIQAISGITQRGLALSASMVSRGSQGVWVTLPDGTVTMPTAAEITHSAVRCPSFTVPRATASGSIGRSRASSFTCRISRRLVPTRSADRGSAPR